MVNYRINRNAVESLIKAGCFEGFGKRLDLIRNYESMLDSALSTKRANVTGQISLTDMVREHEPVRLSEYDESMIEPPTKIELEMEREVLGLYISGHPLREFISAIKSITKYEIFDMKEQIISSGDIPKDLDREIPLVGMVKNLKVKRTKAGKSMAIFEIEDISGSVECVVFPSLYEMSETHLKNDNIITVCGKVELDGEDKIKFTATKIFEFNQNIPVMRLYLRIAQEQRSKMYEIKSILKANPGNTSVYLYYPETNKTMVAPNEYNVSENSVMIDELKMLLGEENVRIVKNREN